MSRPLITAALAACLAPPAAAPAQDRGTFERRLLDAHNAARADIGVAPLAWSARLEGEARAWARHLAREGRMVHADIETRRGAGENLWMGSTGWFSPEVMVGGFVDERRHYRHGTFPDVSRTGNWRDVGHYTQVIWAETTEVGCAIAQGAREEFLVCRYWPAGNYYGQRAY